MSSGEDWSIPCLADGDELEPSPEELDAMYHKLNAGKTIELFWKCPGRRPPTPISTTDKEVKKNANTESPSKNVDFDFMDEVATPTMRVQRPTSTTKSSGKKKTASFASVLDAMKKNKR